MRYVYVIRNLINNKVYVGQTKNFAQRKAEHLYYARKGLKRYLYDAIRKHGEDSFVFEILEECADELINEREKHWVAHFDSFNPEKGYNLTSGGDCEKKQRPVSDITRQKLRLAFLGRKSSTEAKEKISRAMKGRAKSNEQRKKMSESARKDQQRRRDAGSDWQEKAIQTKHEKMLERIRYVIDYVKQGLQPKKISLLLGRNHHEVSVDVRRCKAYIEKGIIH